MAAEGVLKVGDKVSTPDGAGKVSSVGGRFIGVDLKNGSKAQFEPKDLIVAGA